MRGYLNVILKHQKIRKPAQLFDYEITVYNTEMAQKQSKAPYFK